MTKVTRHGTLTGYASHGCRCDECRRASREYELKRRGPRIDREALTDLLHELFPDGLTDDCPARRKLATAA